MCRVFATCSKIGAVCMVWRDQIGGLGRTQTEKRREQFVLEAHWCDDPTKVLTRVGACASCAGRGFSCATRRRLTRPYRMTPWLLSNHAATSWSDRRVPVHKRPDRSPGWICMTPQRRGYRFALCCCSSCVLGSPLLNDAVNALSNRPSPLLLSRRFLAPLTLRSSALTRAPLIPRPIPPVLNSRRPTAIPVAHPSPLSPLRACGCPSPPPPPIFERGIETPAVIRKLP